MLTLSLRLPPGPVQVSVKRRVSAKGPVPAEPAVARLPFHAPEAAQVLALVLDQLRVAAEPLTTLEVEAVRLTVGAGSG